MFSRLQCSLRWCFLWLFYVFLICFLGVLIGTTSHLLWGWSFGSHLESADLALKGCLRGFQYSGLWAGGLSVVICVMRARKEFLLNENARKEVIKYEKQ